MSRVSGCRCLDRPQGAVGELEGCDRDILDRNSLVGANHARALGLDALMPWDTRVDPHGRDPLRPFEEVDELVTGTSRVFHRLDPELGELFDSMRDGDSLDLGSRPGKAPGCYQATLNHARRPFIFMNAAGLDDDVKIFAHEAGHAFHALLSRNEPLLHYRDTGAEISETASMTMELLTHPYLDEFYDAPQADRARHKRLETVVSVLCWVAQIDAFQHWMYDHPLHTRDERAEQWVALNARFRTGESWEGLADNLRADWQRIPHFFSVPFYMIEYGIAQLAALQIWLRSLENEKAALANYKRALRLGASRPLPELFQAAGVEFDFSAQTVRRSTAALRKALRA